MQSYVTQETELFHDSIANNIAIGKPGASREEIMEAAKKASIHDFILSLPDGYDTKVGELGDTLSGGEKQRIGIARAFLHDCPLILLDEPTSNLDSLNEGIILRSLKESARKKTVVLVPSPSWIEYFCTFVIKALSTIEYHPSFCKIRQPSTKISDKQEAAVFLFLSSCSFHPSDTSHRSILSPEKHSCLPDFPVYLLR